jgi:hypothetical protein
MYRFPICPYRYTEFPIYQSFYPLPGNYAQNYYRGGKSNSNCDSNNAAKSSSGGRRAASGYGDRSGYKPIGGNNNYRVASSRVKGNFPGSKGVTCHFCFRLKHFAKNFRQIISKGPAILVADIEARLYNEDYFYELG